MLVNATIGDYFQEHPQTVMNTRITCPRYYGSNPVGGIVMDYIGGEILVNSYKDEVLLDYEIGAEGLVDDAIQSLKSCRSPLGVLNPFNTNGIRIAIDTHRRDLITNDQGGISAIDIVNIIS